jgi:nucleotide-binding universal stress UspA family protein
MRSKIKFPKGRTPIVWGVDLADKNPQDLRKMEAILARWSEGKCEVHPVSIFPTLRSSASKMVDLMRWSQSARTHFDSMIRHSSTPKITPLKCIFQKKTGQRPQDELIRVAMESGAEFIAAQTHSRHGFRHLQLGSFCDGLIGESPIPIFTVNPGTKIPKSINTILFATKFTPNSKHAFKKTLSWAKQRGANLVIVHKIEYPFSPGSNAGLGMGFVIAAEAYQVILDDTIKEAERKMRGWLKIAKTNGVQAKGFVRTDLTSVADSILASSGEAKADVVVVTTRRGPLGQRILGSAARAVLNSSSCPVIVLHE